MAEKPKKQPKSKEEIILDMKNKEHASKMRKFVRDEFYPLLCEATDSISDADIFLQSFSTMIMETFMSFMKEKDFAELEVMKKLDPASPKYATISKLVGLFDGMKINEAQDLIDGMKEEIRNLFRNEMKTRKLDSLKTNWMPDII